MIDIEINNSGDFIIKPRNHYHKFRIIYSTNKYKTLKINFVTDLCATKLASASFRISFDICSDRRQPESISIMDSKELVQNFRLHARTDLNSLNRLIDFGSLYNTFKHKDINNELLLQIKTETENVLKKININDVSVEVKKETGEGYFYCQNISVYIYKENKLLYKFNL